MSNKKDQALTRREPTMPAWLIGLVVYLVLGLMTTRTGVASFDVTTSITAAISAGFRFHWLLLLPPVITLFAAVRRYPVIPGELFAPVYRRRGLAAKNLSRTTEDSGTVVVPLVPWSIAGVFMAGTLGVETLAYAPLAVMCYTALVSQTVEARWVGGKERRRAVELQDPTRDDGPELFEKGSLVGHPEV
jgi:Na+/H+ antiporter NhaC